MFKYVLAVALLFGVASIAAGDPPKHQPPHHNYHHNNYNHNYNHYRGGFSFYYGSPGVSVYYGNVAPYYYQPYYVAPPAVVVPWYYYYGPNALGY